MKCVFCGGKTEIGKATFMYEDENKYLFIENVPAEICTKCGEKTYSPDVTDKLLEFAKNKFKPEKIIKVPVFNFVEKAMG